MNRAHTTIAPKKILAIKLRDLGDTAIWTSALMGLKKAYPEAELHVLVKQTSALLLLDHPAVDKVHFMPSTRGMSVFIHLWRLRAQKFDMALAFHATQSVCRWISLLGAKVRVLHHHSWKFNPVAASLKIESPGKLENAISRDWQILRALGISGEPEPTFLRVADVEKKWAKGQAQEKGIRFEKPVLIMLPGARVETRRYPKDLWEKMVSDLLSKKEHEILVVADPELSKAWDLPKICQEVGVVLFDSVKLRQMMALIQLGSVAIANDSGPLHIAAALGLRTVALFGPGCVGDWHPYTGNRHRLLRLEVDCRPKGPRSDSAFQYCTLTRCSHLSCLRKISPQEVANAVL